MLPEDKNSAYLWDMLDAARTVAQFTSGLTIEKYLKDRKLQLAIERLLEIIGEAANRVSSDFQQVTREFPGEKLSDREMLFHMNMEKSSKNAFGRWYPQISLN